MIPLPRRITVLFLCLFLPACLAGIPGTERPPERLAFTEIGSGDGAENLEGADKLLTVIREADVFNTAYQALTASPPPAIDFRKHLVLLVRMGTCGSTGYSIEVADVRDHEKYVEVHVISRAPGRSCINALALTRPYQFVKIPRTEKEIIFSETLIVTECE